MSKSPIGDNIPTFVAFSLALEVLLGSSGLAWAAEATAPLAAASADMDLKTAALWGFGVTVGLFALFALVAGDGLVGELRVMLGSFFVFFLVITLSIAWIF